MIIWLMNVVGVVSAAAFVLIYAALVRPKGVGAGLLYGALFGLGGGASMGFGSYSVMPIPLSLAVAWCAGMIVEATVAGLIVGLIVKPKAAKADASAQVA